MQELNNLLNVSVFLFKIARVLIHRRFFLGP